MLSSKNFTTARWMALIGNVGLVACLAACSETTASPEANFVPVFWHEKDDFTEIDGYYLDAKVWIDQESSQYLDLQFQCFRHSGAQVTIDQQLLVSSEVDPDASSGRPRFIGAVLFKSEGQSPRVYRDGPDGKVRSTFKAATLDLGSLLFLDGNGSYRDLQLRFVHGVSPAQAEYGDVARLSRADSVDFDLSSSNPETAKFLQACAPIKNWKPTE